MKAKITVNREKVQGEVSPLLFGHFMEHAFGNIYGGVASALTGDMMESIVKQTMDANQ